MGGMYNGGGACIILHSLQVVNIVFPSSQVITNIRLTGNKARDLITREHDL